MIYFDCEGTPIQEKDILTIDNKLYLVAKTDKGFKITHASRYGDNPDSMMLTDEIASRSHVTGSVRHG